MKKIFYSLALFLFLLISFSSASQAATIRINAPKIELELAPGETYTGEILAENPDEGEVETRLYLEDWVYADNGSGEKNFTPASSTPLSASGWINFNPSKEKLPAFGRMTVRYTITVPPDAKGSYYSVLFFETILGNAKDEEGVNVLVAGRIGALFLVQVKGTVNRDGVIKNIVMRNPEGNKPLEIDTTFQNTGNTDITLGGNFLIMDTEGKVLGRGDINKVYTLAGMEATRTTQWIGRLSPGSYQVLLTYDLGKGKTLVEEKTLVIQ